MQTTILFRMTLFLFLLTDNVIKSIKTIMVLPASKFQFDVNFAFCLARGKLRKLRTRLGDQ